MPWRFFTEMMHARRFFGWQKPEDPSHFLAKPFWWSSRGSEKIWNTEWTSVWWCVGQGHSPSTQAEGTLLLVLWPQDRGSMQAHEVFYTISQCAANYDGFFFGDRVISSFGQARCSCCPKPRYVVHVHVILRPGQYTEDRNHNICFGFKKSMCHFCQMNVWTCVCKLLVQTPFLCMLA